MRGPLNYLTWTFSAGFFALAMASAVARTTGAASPYVNQTYGYAVVTPPGVAVQTDPPPSPQHGFDVTLGPGRIIMVDGSYDAGLWGSAEAAARQYIGFAGLRPGLKLGKWKLSLLPAASAAGQAENRITEIVTAYRRRDWEGDSVIYTFVLQTDPAHRLGDEREFDEILAGFRVTVLPK